MQLASPQPWAVGNLDRLHWFSSIRTARLLTSSGEAQLDDGGGKAFLRAACALWVMKILVGMTRPGGTA
jgi:hypothetical protein